MVLQAAVSIWQPGNLQADLSAGLTVSFMSPSTHAAEDLVTSPKLDLSFAAITLADQANHAAASCPTRITR